MAGTEPGSGAASSGDKHLVRRVIFVCLSMALIMGITGVVFFLIPAVNDAVKEALAEGGAVFVGVVIVPAGILAAVTTVWAIRALWRVSDPDYDG